MNNQADSISSKILKAVIIQVIYLLAATQTVFMVLCIAMLISFFGIGIVILFSDQVVVLSNWMGQVFNITHSDTEVHLGIQDILWIYSLLSFIIYLVRLLVRKIFHIIPVQRTFKASFKRASLFIFLGYLLVFIIFKFLGSDLLGVIIFFGMFTFVATAYGMWINRVVAELVKAIDTSSFKNTKVLS